MDHSRRHNSLVYKGLIKICHWLTFCFLSNLVRTKELLQKQGARLSSNSYYPCYNPWKKDYQPDSHYDKRPDLEIIKLCFHAQLN